MAERVRVVEVGPRDGLQNEPSVVPAIVKLELIRRLTDAGVTELEVGSFVSPKWVPQMAGTGDILAGLQQRAGVRHIVLVPNEHGLDRALAAGVREIAVFTAASDAFNRKNINAGVDESLARIAPVARRAHQCGLRVRGYVSTALGCPYQGDVPLAEVVRVTRALVDMGCQEISLADTIGAGTPSRARAMYLACAEVAEAAELAVHFHDTCGQALANVYACLEAGVRVIDASVGGLGGCPYAAGASGNLATEDLVYMLHGLGLHTGIDVDALSETSRWINAQLGREPASCMARLRAKRAA